MKLYFSDQSPHFEQHLQRLQLQPVISYNKEELVEKETSILLNLNKSLAAIDSNFLFDYQIFPPNIMSCYTQWRVENRKMKVGDTIVQQAYIPPYKKLSQKIVFGVRISHVITTPARIGFSYETLQGHVEKGISTFTLETTDKNEVIFKIHTFSQPGNWFTRLLGPVFSVPYQTYCTKQALKEVKTRLEV
jgi:hypothetical protein